jgi:hypothetical protein
MFTVGLCKGDGTSSKERKSFCKLLRQMFPATLKATTQSISNAVEVRSIFEDPELGVGGMLGPVADAEGTAATSSTWQVHDPVSVKVWPLVEVVVVHVEPSHAKVCAIPLISVKEHWLFPSQYVWKLSLVIVIVHPE